MKGSPWRECLLIFLVAVVVALPVWRLTRPAEGVPAEEPLSASSAETLEAWIDITTSHPPESLQVFQNGKLLWEGERQQEMDTDVLLEVSDGRNSLDIHFRWSEDVEKAYTELKLEAGDSPMKVFGFWSDGEGQQVWRMSWERP